MSTNPRSIGWLGTGRMGAAMAARLIDAGEDVTVWNRTASKTGPLVARGARAVERITDLGGCDVVFVMVATPADLEEVVCGEHGLLSADRAGAGLTGADRRPGVIVDCSTVSAETSARVRAAADAAGVGFLAAPVSGNPHVVAEGGCCIVASGPAEVFQQVRPYLEEIAKVAVHAGEEEQSRLVKLCHNLYLGMMVQALAEVTSLAEKGGTDRATFLEFLGGTVVASDWVRKRTGDLVRRDWTPTFTTELLRKDFDLGLDAARSLEVPMPVGAMVYQLIQTAIGTGLRHEDFLSLYELQAAGAAPLRPRARTRHCRRSEHVPAGIRPHAPLRGVLGGVRVTSTGWSAARTASCSSPRTPRAVPSSSACRTTAHSARCCGRSPRTRRTRC